MQNEELVEPGHGDLDAPLVLSVVAGSGILLFVVVTLLRAFVYNAINQEVERKVIDREYGALQDNRIEQLIQLSEYAVNDDGKTGRVPIEVAERLFVQQYAATHAKGQAPTRR